MQSFLDIPHIPLDNGKQWKFFFDNGYGASVIQTIYSYGSKDGLYELAVLKGTLEGYDLCYDTEITADVIGYLEEAEVNEILLQIQLLPKYKMLF